jgi:hypothetical protein
MSTIQREIQDGGRKEVYWCKIWWERRLWYGVVSCFETKSQISIEECVGALSWWSHFFSLHESGLFFSMHLADISSLQDSTLCWQSSHEVKFMEHLHNNKSHYHLHIWPNLSCFFFLSQSDVFETPLWTLKPISSPVMIFFYFRHCLHGQKVLSDFKMLLFLSVSQYIWQKCGWCTQCNRSELLFWKTLSPCGTTY